MKTTTPLGFCLAFLAFHQSTIPSNAASYSIKGSLSYQTYALRPQQPPGDEKPLLREFEVQVDDLAWKITIVLAGNTNFDSLIYFYDRTNLVQYSIVSQPGRAVAGVSVEESPVPGTETSAAGEYVWLAFASGNYLKAQTNNALLSFEELRSPNGFIKRFHQPSHSLLSEASPYLPIAVDYRMTNWGVFLDTNGNPHVLSLPQSFQSSGYASAAFRAEAFTNVHGFSFPTKFEYNKYQPKANAATTNDLKRVLSVAGVVKSISMSEQSVDHALPRKMLVFDRRVPEPGLHYPVDDGVIPATNSYTVVAARLKFMEDVKGSTPRVVK